MASRRATVTLARASAPLTKAAVATPARLRAAVHLSSRQHHTQPTGQRLRPSVSALCAGRASSPIVSTSSRRLTPAAARAYSADAEGKPHKIWDFEALQKLTTAPHPDITIVDVREPQELQDEGRIPGAINIPVKSAPDSYHITDEEFEDRFGYPRPPHDAEVVFYCRAGVRSRAAAELAKEAGWTKVGEYPGSWLDWAGKGGKIQR